MMEKVDNVHAQLTTRLRQLRSGRSLTLDGLAEKSGVSRSMISLIERGESSPTAAVLYRLAVGLGVPLASLFDEAERADASPVARRAAQAEWQDPETGYLRRSLSPPGHPSPLELVEVHLPPGARVAYDHPGATRLPAVSQQVWVLEGEVEITVGDATHALAEGDCLAMQLDRPTAFRNRTAHTTRYLVAVTAGPHR